MITHYPFLPPRKLYKLLWASRNDIARVESLLRDYFGKPVILLNAGRTGIFLTLAAKGFKKTQEVLVPPYVSKCVLDTISECAVPTLHLSPLTKAVLVVHQYGYPQRMDEIMTVARKNNLLVIEDSAFSFGSIYKDAMVGSFGDAAIFTFPKAFETILGGCLVTEDEQILSFAKDYLRRHDTFIWRSLSTLALFPATFEYGTGPGRLHTVANHLLTLAYSKFLYFPNPNKRVCHLFPKTKEEFARQLQVRKDNLAIFKEYFGNTPAYPKDLEQDIDVVPFVVPFFGQRDRLDRIVEVLSEKDIRTGVYHFDINRNMFDQKYVPAVLVPVHQVLDEAMMRSMCETIAHV